MGKKIRSQRRCGKVIERRNGRMQKTSEIFAGVKKPGEYLFRNRVNFSSNIITYNIPKIIKTIYYVSAHVCIVVSFARFIIVFGGKSLCQAWHKVLRRRPSVRPRARHEGFCDAEDFVKIFGRKIGSAETGRSISSRLWSMLISRVCRQEPRG